MYGYVYAEDRNQVWLSSLITFDLIGCAYVLYVHIHVGACTCVCAYMWSSETDIGYLPQSLFTFSFLKQDLSLNLELIDLTKLAGQ